MSWQKDLKRIWIPFYTSLQLDYEDTYAIIELYLRRHQNGIPARNHREAHIQI
jgi:hypothetical protein